MSEKDFEAGAPRSAIARELEALIEAADQLVLDFESQAKSWNRSAWTPYDEAAAGLRGFRDKIAALRACAEAPETVCVPHEFDHTVQPVRCRRCQARWPIGVARSGTVVDEEVIATRVIHDSARACAEARPSTEQASDYDVCACGHYRSTHGHGGKICDGWMPGGTGHHEAQCRCVGFHLNWPASPRAEALAPHPQKGEVQVTEEDARGQTTGDPQSSRTASKNEVA